MPYGHPSCGIDWGGACFANMGVGVVRIIFKLGPKRNKVANSGVL